MRKSLYELTGEARDAMQAVFDRLLVTIDESDERRAGLENKLADALSDMKELRSEFEATKKDRKETTNAAES